MDFIDLHCHILPDLDDGARDWKTAEAMFRKAAESGVRAIVCTTHANPAQRVFPLDEYRATLAKAGELCAKLGLGITLYPGAEIMYADVVAERQLDAGKIPTLAGSRHVLIEFYPDVKYDQIIGAVRRLGNAGYKTVIAHIERYGCLAKKAGYIEELKDEGALLQMNCGVFINKAGFFFRRYIDKLLTNGTPDLVATDAHGITARPVNIGECYAKLTAEHPELDLAHLFDARRAGIIPLKHDNLILNQM